MTTPNNQPTPTVPATGDSTRQRVKSGDPEYFCQWCYDRGLRYPDDGLPWRHSNQCPNQIPETGDTTNEKGGEQRQELPIPEASYSCGGSCREDRSLPADDLAWFPKVKLWLCSECSEDTEEVGDAEITLEDYLKTRK